MLTAEWDAAAPSTTAEERTFYATSLGYLYNLTIWEASGNRPPYLRQALPVLHDLTPRRVIGCGIGSDALALHDLGYTVLASDLPSPHARFAAWRAHQRRNRRPAVDH